MNKEYLTIRHSYLGEDSYDEKVEIINVDEICPNCGTKNMYIMLKQNILLKDPSDYNQVKIYYCKNCKEMFSLIDLKK